MKTYGIEQLTYNCIVCDIPLEKIDDLQPLGGLHFLTYGHYGSTFFDPLDGSTLNIFVCDSCLSRKNDKTSKRNPNEYQS